MDEIMTALATTQYEFVAYAWDHAPNSDYGVVTLNEGNDLQCDNMHVEFGLTGFIDYFTRDATNTPKSTIESALNGKCAFKLNSVQYESDTGYIHYEWTWSLYA